MREGSTSELFNVGGLEVKRSIVLCVLGVLAVLSVASVATGKTAAPVTSTFKATLNAAQVTPNPKGTKAGASGTFKATLTGTKLKWTLTYKNLTGPARAAHIHLGARGKNGIALVAICGPCKASPISGTANSVTDDEAALMMKGGAYVNVHTDKNPEGEIRGSITGH
jgi:CHRD domain-containing protein